MSTIKRNLRDLQASSTRQLFLWIRVIQGPIATSAVTSTLTFIATISLYRQLHLNDAGILTLVLAIVQLLMMVAGLGQPTLIQRMYSQTTDTEFNWPRDLSFSILVSFPFIILISTLATYKYGITSFHVMLIIFAATMQIAILTESQMLSAMRHYAWANLLLRMPNSLLIVPAVAIAMFAVESEIDTVLTLYSGLTTVVAATGLTLLNKYLPRGKIVGIGPPYPWWPPETADHLGEQWRTLLRASGGPYEGIERRGNGTRMFVEGNMRPVIGATGDAETLITVVRDVTARAEAEEALLAAHETIAVADDRERIAWNLHDNVIQQIFAVGLGLQSVSNRLDDDVAERIGEFVGQLDATIAEVRNTIFELSRSRRAIGLRQELLEVVQQEQVALGFEVDLSFTGPMDAVPADIATEAVPVLREALSNVVRHSFASSVSVAVLVQRDHLFALTVEDNGRGLDEVVKRGRGLDNMERRATALRGTFSAGAAARGGTCIVWSVPIER